MRQPQHLHSLGLFVQSPCDLDEAVLTAVAERINPEMHEWLIAHADDWEYVWETLDSIEFPFCRLWVAFYDAADAAVFLLTFGPSRRSSF